MPLDCTRVRPRAIAFFLLSGSVISFLMGCGDSQTKTTTRKATTSAKTEDPARQPSPDTANPATSDTNNKTTEDPRVKETSAKNLPQPTPANKETGLIPRELLFGNPDKAAARISPDGKQLSYLAPVEGVLNVWVGPIDNPDAAKPVTKDKKRGIRSYFWAYTNKHILYTQDDDGDEDWNVYRVDLATLETTNLTPIKKVHAQIEEVSHRSPTEILIGLNDRDPQFHDIYRLNIETGERELVQKNEQGFAGYRDRRGLSHPVRHAVHARRRAATAEVRTAMSGRSFLRSPPKT